MLWLAVYGHNFKSCSVEPHRLRAAGIAFYQSKGQCMVPLVLPDDVELDAVVVCLKSRSDALFQSFQILAVRGTGSLSLRILSFLLRAMGCCEPVKPLS